MQRVATLLLLGFLGCQSHCASHATTPSPAKEACACKDFACAQDVQRNWAERMAARASTDATEPSDEDKQAIKLMTDCMTRLANAE